MIASADNRVWWQSSGVIRIQSAATATAALDMNIDHGTVTTDGLALAWEIRAQAIEYFAGQLGREIEEVLTEVEQLQRKRRAWTKERIEIAKSVALRWPPRVVTRPRQSPRTAGRTCSAATRWRVLVP